MRGVLGHRVDQQPQGKRPSDLLHRSGGFVLVVVAPVVVVVVVVAAAEHSPILCSGSITCDACDASSAAAAPPYASPRRVLLRYTHPSKQPHNLALSIHIHILLLLVNYTAAAAAAVEEEDIIRVVVAVGQRRGGLATRERALPVAAARRGDVPQPPCSGTSCM
jgi:hypothetical protein